MNSCSWSEARFERYLDGDLAAHEASRLAAHLDRCTTCREVLAELRAVDALLLTPRRVELPANFTFATMAEVRTRPVPRRSHAPAAAYVLSYLAAAWILVGALVALEPAVMSSWFGAFADLARAFADALGGVGGSLARSLLRDAGVRTPVLISLALVLDVTLALGFGALVAALRPRLLERLRS